MPRSLVIRRVYVLLAALLTLTPLEGLPVAYDLMSDVTRTSETVKPWLFTALASLSPARETRVLRLQAAGRAAHLSFAGAARSHWHLQQSERVMELGNELLCSFVCSLHRALRLTTLSSRRADAAVWPHDQRWTTDWAGRQGHGYQGCGLVWI